MVWGRRTPSPTTGGVGTESASSPKSPRDASRNRPSIVDGRSAILSYPSRSSCRVHSARSASSTTAATSASASSFSRTSSANMRSSFTSSIVYRFPQRQLAVAMFSQKPERKKESSPRPSVSSSSSSVHGSVATDGASLLRYSTTFSPSSRASPLECFCFFPGRTLSFFCRLSCSLRNAPSKSSLGSLFILTRTLSPVLELERYADSTT
mmetsp:Transcript_7449/g.17349  ORF Transcript_7449/g.17349 Transcript_7449/m.17349 type:complete len:209 (-) Transcript_7449:936-1562(-)